MTFSKTVLAYLTGWVIAQAFYNRLRRYAIDSRGEAWAARLARLTADEIERREAERDTARRERLERVHLGLDVTG